MKHKDSGWRCLVAHYDDEDNILPACIKCNNCGAYIRPEEMDNECPAEAEDAKESRLSVTNPELVIRSC